MTKKYVTPEIMVVNVQGADIIQTSGAVQSGPMNTIDGKTVETKVGTVSASDIFG